MITKHELPNKQTESPSHATVEDSWFDENTADYWRHNRMYQIADCVLHKKDATWLTVGDGRFGLDSIRLGKRGIGHVLPSDIDEKLLEESKQKGLITDYSVQDAQHMDFTDASFDFVFCKESYHHFPQPALGLYEMLRIAREAVFMIEPNDQTFKPSPFQQLKNLVKCILGKGNEVKASYEPDGNYIYSVSRREMEKVALGINMPAIAFKGLNDCYIRGVEYEPADVRRSPLFRKIKRRIRIADIKCRLGWGDYGLLMVGLFKNEIDPETRSRLQNAGWNVVDLPRNPYSTV